MMYESNHAIKGDVVIEWMLPEACLLTRPNGRQKV